MRGGLAYLGLRLIACCAAAALSPVPAFAADPNVDLGASYVSDTFANVRGGRERGVRVMGKLDLTAEVNGVAFGIEGAQAYLNLQLLHGESLSEELVGDGQVVSNIDAPPGQRVLEAWLKLPFGGGAGFAKAGLIDLNTDFDVQSVGGLFVNSSHGIGPDFSQSGLNGPSIYPTTSSAVVIGWKQPSWSARAGLFDAVPGDPDRPRRTVVRFPGESGLLLVAEADVAVGASAEFQIGAWTYTTRFDAVRQPREDAQQRLSGNRGAYAMVEGTLSRHGERTLDGWVRAGVAETSINPIGFYAGGGLSFGGDDSRFGVAVGHARLGDPAIAPAEIRPDRAETNIELTWSRRLSEQLTVQPDLQYVINPGWNPALHDAFVLGLRLDITLF